MARPRKFDVDEALDRAVDVFWEHGYEGSTLGVLTAAMGINPPSLYAAFGSKQGLFERALQRYRESDQAGKQASLNEPDVRSVVSEYLHRTVSSVTNPEHPAGCLVVEGALKCGDEAAPAAAMTAAHRKAGLLALRERLERAEREGERLPMTPELLALYVTTIGDGLAIRGTDATPADQLHIVVTTAVDTLFAQ